MNPIDIKTLSLEALAAWLAARHIEPYRAEQIFKWIYQRQADRFDQMTNLNKENQGLLAGHFSIPRLETVCVETSVDGTLKYLFRLADRHFIESVLIPEKNHYTLCISSQVGCAQGCRFCRTGKDGFTRNLTAAEIVSQVRDILNTLEKPEQLSNIVFMGMGEPLANYDPVVSAIQTITDSRTGLNFSSRRITLSTAGLVPMLARFGHDTTVNLAISLNATDNRTRSRLMPVNRRYPIEVLIEACRQYPLPPRRRITFEYVLLHGVNDTPDDARRLAQLLRPVKAKINLIPFNPHDGSEFDRPSDAAVFTFQEILVQQHYTVMIRQSKGRDISAACGQLKARSR